MPTKQQTGSKGAVLVGGRDVTRHVKNYSSNITLGVDDETALQPPNNAMSFVAALQGGAAQLAGMLPVPKAMAEPELQAALGVQRDAEEFVCMPWGQTVGYYSEFFQVIQNRLQVQGMTANISTFSADYQATGGVKAGPVLLASQGADTIARNAKFAVVATNARGNAVVTFYDELGVAVGTVTVHPGDSTATVKAAIEALAYYNTVNVTGSVPALAPLSATTAPSDVTSLGAGTIPIGNYNIKYTYTDSFGETTPSAPTNINTAAADEQFNMTAPALPSGATGTKWYMTQDAGSIYYLVGTSASNTFDINNAPAGTEAQPPVSNTSGASVSGTYDIEVVSPAPTLAVSALPAPSTASSGWSASLLQKGVLISNAHLINAAGVQTAVDNGASTNDGGYTQLNCTYASVDCNAIVRVRHADDSAGSPGTWSTLASFAAVTGEGSQFLEIPRGTTIKQWTRVEVLTGDITGEFTASVVLDRNPPIA